MDSLITRWQNNDLITFHKKLEYSLSTGVFQENLTPFGQFNGRWDFRGYDFSIPRFITNCHIENVDFGLANFEHVKIQNSKLANIHFEQSKFYDYSDHGCVFNDCVFFKSSLHYCILGFDGSKYENCLYEKCQFRRTHCIRAEFTNCKFYNNNLNGTEFGASSFEDCVFTGKVKNVWFCGGYLDADDEQTFGKAKPNPMTISFKDAELIEMTYSMECALSNIILPEKGIYYRFDKWKERLEYIRDNIKQIPQSEERNKIQTEIDLRMYKAPYQSWIIINMSECVKKMGEETAKKYIELLSSYNKK